MGEILKIVEQRIGDSGSWGVVLFSDGEIKRLGGRGAETNHPGFHTIEWTQGRDQKGNF